MPALASAIAILLYLLPVGWVLAIVSSQKSTAARVGVTIPAAAAADLVVVLGLSRLVPLEWAIFASRVLYVAAGLAWMRSRGIRAAELCRGLPANVWKGALLATLLAVLASLVMSIPYWIWDREWHVPLVSTLRGERLPFANVYEPSWPIRYHIAGDVVASELQVLSFGVIHSSRALSLAHDAMFGLLGCTVGLFVQSFGFKRALPTALSPLAIVLAGPVWAKKGPQGLFEGYSDFNNLTLSFRPHVVLAGLLISGIAGAALLYVFDRKWSARECLAVLFPCFCILAISDEASTILLLASLGTGWLARVPTDGRARWLFRGALVFVGLAVVAYAANLAFAGALSPGGPVSSRVWVAPRIPGFRAPALSLADPTARVWLALDLALEISVLVALVPWVLRRPAGARVSVLLGFAALLIASTFLFACVEINGLGFENHRFLTAVRFVSPLCALFVIGTEPRSFPAIVSTLAIGAATASTAGFVLIRMPEDHSVDDRGQYAINCSSQTGARPIEKPSVAYLSDEVWYLYAGCHPVYAPAVQERATMPKNYMKAGWPAYGTTALRDLHQEMVLPGAPLKVVCPRAGSHDAVCQAAEKASPCTNEGTDILVCSLSDGDRRLLLGLSAP